MPMPSGAGMLATNSPNRAAGAAHGQEMPPEAMDALICSIGREPRQRSTLYGTPPEGQVKASYGAAPLSPTIEPRAGKFARAGSSRAKTFQLTQA